MSVYFAERDGLIKIGSSGSVDQRVRGLHASLLAEIDIGDRQASHRAERQLHRLFADERVQGEWFTPSRRLSAFIVALPKVVREEVPHPLMTARQVADYFRVSVNTVDRWARLGYVQPAFRLMGPRGQFRFDRSYIEQIAKSA